MAGEEGNNFSSKNNRLWRETLRRVAAQNPEKLRRIAEKLYEQAEQGDIAAMREIGDRLDGKAAQTIQGDDENPLTVAIKKIELVALK